MLMENEIKRAYGSTKNKVHNIAKSLMDEIIHYKENGCDGGQDEIMENIQETISNLIIASISHGAIKGALETECGNFDVKTYN